MEVVFLIQPDDYAADEYEAFIRSDDEPEKRVALLPSTHVTYVKAFNCKQIKICL